MDPVPTLYGIAATIEGTLTLTKLGTTARTATFPDAAINVAGSASVLSSTKVPYATSNGTLADSGIYWDSYYKYVGINVAAPTGQLEVNGTAGVPDSEIKIVGVNGLTDNCYLALVVNEGGLRTYGGYFKLEATTADLTWVARTNLADAEFFRIARTTGLVTAAGNVKVGGGTTTYKTNGTLFLADGIDSATDIRFGVRPALSTTIAGLRFACNNITAAIIDGCTFDAGGTYSAAKLLALNGSGGGLVVGAYALAGSEALRVVGGGSPGTPASTNVLIGNGEIKAAGLISAGSNFYFGSGSFANGSAWTTASNGLLVACVSGSSTDFYLASPTSGASIMQVPAGTQNVTFGGSVSCTSLATTSARTLQVRSVTSAAGTTALDGTDDVVVVTGTTTQTITLPACATGRRLTIKNRSTGNVTVNRAGSDTIDGATSVVLTLNDRLHLVGNGTDWADIT